MEKRDFLLREIEKLTQLIKKLVRVMEAITSENFEVEFGKINNELVNFFGFTFEELTKIENSEFINNIKDIDEANLELIAILILETVKKLQSTSNNNKINSTELAKKGIVLIDFIEYKTKNFSINRMNLKKELQHYV